MNDPYQDLAKALDGLPNGFPAAPDGAELRILAHLFDPDEAALAARLSPQLETLAQLKARQVLERLALSDEAALDLLRGMARKGLIKAGRASGGLGFALMPFVVGIYEMQIGTLDAELARLFEDYFHQSFGQVLAMQPALHRIVPVGENVRLGMEIHPYENAASLIDQAQSWGVLDCICRSQKALLGQACEHPIDVCMAFGAHPDQFNNHPIIRPLTQVEAHEVLHRAASVGLVHTVSNSKEGIGYICNCCTCSCGILRGMSELGLANVVARSAFVNRLDLDLCVVCGDCLPYCQFEALVLEDGRTRVIKERCVGCGVCVPACPEGALGLVRRPEREILPIAQDETEWGAWRLAARQSPTPSEGQNN